MACKLPLENCRLKFTSFDGCLSKQDPAHLEDSFAGSLMNKKFWKEKYYAPSLGKLFLQKSGGIQSKKRN